MMIGFGRSEGESRGGHALDVPVAALAGLSVAFLAFAMPADLLGELVTASGLPSLVAGAQPPLGFTARTALAAGGGLVVFALAFLLLRWLGQVGTRPAADEPDADGAEPLRIRRRDFHPDAAPRPPLFAAAELGEPDIAAGRVAEPPPELTLEVEAESELAEEPEPVEEAEPEPASREAPGHHAWLAEAASAAPEPAVAPPRIGTSIPELMERLERGLERRRSAEPARAEPPARPQPAPFADPADHRLQSAIESLQRLAARQH